MKLSTIAGRMVRVIVISSLVCITASAVYYRSFDFLPFALGVFLGAGLNIVKVLMLERAVDKSVVMESAAAGNHIRLQYLLRFLLTGVVLFLSVFVPFVNLWGTVAGILTLQVAVLSVRFAKN